MPVPGCRARRCRSRTVRAGVPHRPVARKSSQHHTWVFNRAVRHRGAPRAPRDKSLRRAPTVSDEPTYCAQAAGVARSDLRLVSKSKQSDYGIEMTSVSVAVCLEKSRVVDCDCRTSIS